MASSQIEIKFPSIRYNFSSKLYYELPYLSQSLIGRYVNNSEYAAYYNEFTDTDSMRFGRCFHHLFLNQLLGRFVSCPTFEVDRRTNQGKLIYQDLIDRGIRDYFKSETEVKEAYHLLKVVSESVKNKPNQAKLFDEFKTNGQVEVTIFWQDLDGNQYKSRLDGCILDVAKRSARILDLKTVASYPKTKNLYFNFRDNDYDLQMFTYISALRSCGFQDITYTLLLVERETGNYGFYNYTAGDSAFNDGAEKFSIGLNRYLTAKNKIKNNVPLSASMSDDIDDVSHPQYEAF